MRHESLGLWDFAPQDGQRKFKGQILAMQDGKVKMDVDGVEITLNFENIAKARLVPDYDSLMAARKETGS